MKAAVVLSFVAAVMAGTLEKRECHGNNCARQVTGTREGLTPISERKADCSSFMVATVVPEPTTTTITVTVYDDESTGGSNKLLKRAASTEYPTAIPAYASSCDDGAEYSSVCSCWGVTASVTTAPTPTETKTITTTIDYCDDL